MAGFGGAGSICNSNNVTPHGHITHQLECTPAFRFKSCTSTCCFQGWRAVLRGPRHGRATEDCPCRQSMQTTVTRIRITTHFDQWASGAKGRLVWVWMSHSLALISPMSSLAAASCKAQVLVWHRFALCVVCAGCVLGVLCVLCVLWVLCVLCVLCVCCVCCVC